MSQQTLARGIAFDETSGSPQLIVNDNGAAVVRSVGLTGTANWTAGTSAISNVDLEVDAVNGRIFQTVLGGVDVLGYAAPAGPAPGRAFTLSGTGAFLQMDPTGVTGLLGPAGNRTFVAVSDFADPSSIVFFHLGTDPQGRDSFPTLRLTDSTAPRRYVSGRAEDPAPGDIYVATHPAGQALRHTNFRILRYCPRT